MSQPNMPLRVASGEKSAWSAAPAISRRAASPPNSSSPMRRTGSSVNRVRRSRLRGDIEVARRRAERTGGNGERIVPSSAGSIDFHRP